MKKTVRILALAMALTMVLFAFAACGTKLSGTYEGTLTKLTFDGDEVTASDKLGIVKITGTYEIKGDKMTLTFGDDKLSLGGEHSFEKDGDTIKINGIKYTKAD